MVGEVTHPKICNTYHTTKLARESKNEQGCRQGLLLTRKKNIPTNYLSLKVLTNEKRGRLKVEHSIGIS
jgi:hypothetical protein